MMVMMMTKKMRRIKMMMMKTKKKKNDADADGMLLMMGAPATVFSATPQIEEDDPGLRGVDAPDVEHQRRVQTTLQLLVRVCVGECRLRRNCGDLSTRVCVWVSGWVHVILVSEMPQQQHRRPCVRAGNDDDNDDNHVIILVNNNNFNITTTIATTRHNHHNHHRDHHKNHAAAACNRSRP